jgi:hypothetical protein
MRGRRDGRDAMIATRLGRSQLNRSVSRAFRRVRARRGVGLAATSRLDGIGCGLRLVKDARVGFAAAGDFKR